MLRAMGIRLFHAFFWLARCTYRGEAACFAKLLGNAEVPYAKKSGPRLLSGGTVFFHLVLCHNALEKSKRVLGQIAYHMHVEQIPPFLCFGTDT